MSDIVTLQARLEQAKHEQLEAKKQLRAKKAELRQRAIMARKMARKGMPTFWDRCERAIDSWTLSLCKPFEQRAHNLRRKQADPEGYEADCTVADIARIITHLEKKSKKRELNNGEVDVLVRLDTTINTIAEKQLGTTTSAEISSMLERINDLLPEAVKAQMAVIDGFDLSSAADDPEGAMKSCLQELLNAKV